MLLITWQKLSPVFAFLSGKIGFRLPNAPQTCTNHVCQPVWVRTAVNTSKHAAEKNANEPLSSNLNAAHWRSREMAKLGGNYLWAHYFRLTSHMQCKFFLRTLHECEWKTRPTLTVVRLSNVKDLICPFSKNTFNTFGIRSRESSLSIVWKRLRVKSLSAVIKSKFVHCYWNKKKKSRTEWRGRESETSLLWTNNGPTEFSTAREDLRFWSWWRGEVGGLGVGGGGNSSSMSIQYVCYAKKIEWQD